MSNLSTEQLEELWELVGTRRAEFSQRGSPHFMLAPMTHGEVRMIFDAIEEWQCRNPLPMVELSSPGIGDTDMMDGYHIGYQRGREAMRAELGLLEKAGGWVGTQDQGQRLVASPSFIINQDQIRADIRELGKAYPSLEPEPSGTDIYAGVHPVTGGPERKRPPTIDEEFAGSEVLSRLIDAVEPPPVIAPLPEPVAIPIVADVPTPKPTNGNGHHAEPSPATIATLGPEHTVVTPIVPRRSNAPVVDDDALDRLSRPGARAKKELDELRAKAAAKARLGEVTREQMVAELKRQAMAGTMPTQEQFDIAKPAVWPKAQMLVKRFDAGWTDLAREAGLKLVRR